MSDHPRLTRVLADALSIMFGGQDRTYVSGGLTGEPATLHDAGLMVAAMPPAVADRLEDALDACRFVFPDGTPCQARGREPVHGAREGDWQHAFDPLVAP